MTEELGPFRRIDPSVVEGDPFWSPVRRRHPDVDLILLPDEPATDVPRPPVSDAESVQAAVAGLLDAWGVVRPLLVGYGVVDPPSVRWSGAGSRHVLVLQKAAVGVGQDAGADLLRDLAARLTELGWGVEPGMRGWVPAVWATARATTAEAVAGPGAAVVTVTGVALSVTPEVRDATRAEVRAAVASWQ